MLPEDLEGDELTGGYILKVDRPDPGAWISPYKGRTGRQNVPISYVDPKYDELLPVQREYIKNFVTNFEHALHGPDFKDPEKGYRPFVDINSFADYFIINELSRNLDAYRVSNYFHKTKDRIIWMDQQIEKFPELTTGTDAPLASVIESKAYPSPFVNEVNISFQLPQNAEIQLNIYDASGKRIVSRKLQSDSGLNRIRLDAGNWSKSHLYFYTLTNNGVSVGNGKMMRRIE